MQDKHKDTQTPLNKVTQEFQGHLEEFVDGQSTPKQFAEQVVNAGTKITEITGERPLPEGEAGRAIVSGTTRQLTEDLEEFERRTSGWDRVRKIPEIVPIVSGAVVNLCFSLGKLMERGAKAGYSALGKGAGMVGSGLKSSAKWVSEIDTQKLSDSIIEDTVDDSYNNDLETNIGNMIAGVVAMAIVGTAVAVAKRIVREEGVSQKASSSQKTNGPPSASV
jgi:hypothetical protein